MSKRHMQGLSILGYSVQGVEPMAKKPTENKVCAYTLNKNITIASLENQITLFSQQHAKVNAVGKDPTDSSWMREWEENKDCQVFQYLGNNHFIPKNRNKKKVFKCAKPH